MCRFPHDCRSAWRPSSQKSGTHERQKRWFQLHAAGEKGLSDVLNDFVQGKRRILFNFWHYGTQSDNLSDLAVRWDYKSGGGNFNKFVNELVTEKRLKRFPKNDRMYLTITWRGCIAILPLILPFILMAFFLLVSFVFIADTIPSIMGVMPLPVWTFLILGIVLLVFSAVGLILVRRMETFLLEKAK